jgi:putative chitinase
MPVNNELKISNPREYRRSYLEDYAISSGMGAIELAAFMARIHHETGAFRYMYELGNPEYFEKYEGRKDLGNVEDGDGYLYRGRGYIQLTGRANYEKYGPIVGADLVNFPDLAADEEVAARVAVAFWNKTKVRDGRTIAEAARDGDIEVVVKGVNGGLNGFQETLKLYEQYLNAYS